MEITLEELLAEVERVQTDDNDGWRTSEEWARVLNMNLFKMRSQLFKDLKSQGRLLCKSIEKISIDDRHVKIPHYKILSK